MNAATTTVNTSASGLGSPVFTVLLALLPSASGRKARLITVRDERVLLYSVLEYPIAHTCSPKIEQSFHHVSTTTRRCQFFRNQDQRGLVMVI